MTDTFTDNLNLTLQENGTNNNTWNDKYGSNYEYIDAKLGDRTTVNTTGGTTVLTASQERVSVIKVTGTLVSNAIIEFTGVGGTWVVENDTSGAYTVTCMINGQTGVEVTQGNAQQVYFDGTDIQGASGVPQGLTTDDSPQFAGLNVGHATDTTITRLAAGQIGVEGNAIARIKTGSYTGNGATSQSITGIGFTPKYVKVWERKTSTGAMYSYETTTEIIDDIATGAAILLADSGFTGTTAPFMATNAIIALGSDGFTVDDNGADLHPNKNGQIYNYICLG